MQKNDLKSRSYDYALNMVTFIDTLPKQDYSTSVIARQLLRSATSVGANIAEAQAGSTKKDFGNFYNHALKSANESAFWLRLLRDAGKAGREQVDELHRETIELANILGSSLLTLRGKRRPVEQPA